MAYNLKFAGKLKDMTCMLFAWDRKRLDEDLEYKEAEAFWPDGTPVSVLGQRARTRREILQLIGTDLFRAKVDYAIWLHAAAADIPSDTPLIVATDIRFDNELEFLQERGHKVHCVRLGRTGTDAGTQSSGHVSEAGIRPGLIAARADVPDGDFDFLRHVALRGAKRALEI